MAPEEDQSVSDAKCKKEIEKAVNDFRDSLLWSKRDPDEKAGKMNKALERESQYVDMP